MIIRSTLKENMPNKCQKHWHQLMEHRMFRWMDAYRDGLDVKAAQLKVRQNSSVALILKQ